MNLWLNRIVNGAILAAAFLAPLLFLPVTPDPLFIKVVLVQVAAVVAIAAWLLEVIVSKRLRFTSTPLNALFLLVALIMVIALLGSLDPWGSFWGPDPTGEKVASVLSFLVLAFLAQATFDRRDVIRAARALMSSFALLGLFTLTAVVAGQWLTLPAWLAVNPVGTGRALGGALAVGLAMSTALALSSFGAGGRRFIPRGLALVAGAAAVLLFASLVFLRFRTVWVGVAGAMLLLLAFYFTRARRREGGGAEYPFSYSAAGAVFVLLIAALAFSFAPLPLASRIYQPPADVSPSFFATLAIAGRSLRADPLTGVGPANFALAYDRFRDVAINATPFWAVRFSHGFSFLATLPSTIGPIGALVFLALPLLAAFLCIRGLWRAPENDPLLLAAGAGIFMAAYFWFLAPGNFTSSFLLFLAVGLSGALLKEPPPVEAPAAVGAGAPGGAALRDRLAAWRRRPRWRVAERTISLDSPAAAFVVSLVAVFAAAMSLVAFWSIGSYYAAEVYLRRADLVLTQFGNVDSAQVFTDRAASLHPLSDRYHRARAQVARVAVERIIAQAAIRPAEDLSLAFRQEFTAGVRAAERAIALAPYDRENRIALAQLYEAVVPFLAGADLAALDAYERARADDPVDPLLLLAEARVRLAVADVSQVRAVQARPGQPQKDLFQARAAALAAARQALESSLGLKPDLASAHFLLAQAAIREDNLEQAISSAEATARLAPGDIGVAFQLGFLYYRADRLEEAQAAFERALLLNENYSNARYFLGLIYDRRGERDGALSQFEKIAALNPDNEEVKRIIANLRRGRPALEGIVPPAQAPEERKEAPVRENESRGRSVPER